MAATWASILTDEFARQASMEVELGIPTALFAPPVRDSIVELGKSQIGFMNLFALPLFVGVSDVLPAMRFSVDEIVTNKGMWEAKIKQGEVEREEDLKDSHLRAPTDGVLSPRSRSVSTQSQSPEPHPPTLVAAEAGGATSPLLSSPRDPMETSPRSSLTTLGHLAGSLPEPARVSHMGDLEGPMEAGQDTASRRSSGVCPTTSKLHGQRSSSNTALRSNNQVSALGLPSPERRASADHSLVAVLVTSPGGKRPKTSPKAAKRHSSEKGSLPSSNEWQSQTTSPTTNVTYSPTTEATSILSETSSERVRFDGVPASCGAGAMALAMMGSSDSTEQSWTGNSSSTTTTTTATDPMGKSIRHRPSRWKLSHFWKNRRKTTSNGSSP